MIRRGAAAHRAVQGRARKTASLRNRDIRIDAPRGLQHAGEGDFAVERCGRISADARRVEVRGGGVGGERTLSVEIEACTSRELAAADARAKPRHLDARFVKSSSEVDGETATQLAVDEIAADRPTPRVKVGDN